MNRTGRVRQGYYPGAQLGYFFRGKLSHISGTGHSHCSAFKTFAGSVEHLLGKIHTAIAGGFGTDQGPAPVETFAC